MYEQNIEEINEMFHKKGITGVDIKVNEMDITFY